MVIKYFWDLLGNGHQSLFTFQTSLIVNRYLFRYFIVFMYIYINVHLIGNSWLVVWNICYFPQYME